MGLPEKIKNTLTKSTTQSKDAATVSKNAKSPSTGPTRKMPADRGLPTFKAPELPSRYRAMLVVCSTTRKASWAVLKNDPRASEVGERGWSFQRSLPAVPENRHGPQTTQRSPKDADTSKDPEISMQDVDLSGFSCGVCGGHGEYAGRLVQCGACGTLQCQPAEVWACPGCGGQIGEQPLGEIESLAAGGGSQPATSRPGLAAAGSPDRSKQLGQSRQITPPT